MEITFTEAEISETFTVPMELLRLYRDVQVRVALERLIEEPLTKPGIESFKLLNAARVVTGEVSKAEATYFIAPQPTDAVLLNQQIRAAYTIVSLAFKEDNKWRLHDGNSQISATITDEEFLDKVDKSIIRFAKGDVLMCDVRVEQIQTPTGLRTNFTVIKVVEHIPAMRQLDIFTDAEKGINSDKLE